MRTIKTEGNVVGAHFQILKILRAKGPLTRAELQKELEWPPQSLKDRLKRLCQLNEIKFEDGKYAMFDYVGYEVEVEKIIRELYKEKIPRFVHSNFKNTLTVKIAQKTNQSVDKSKIAEAAYIIYKKLGIIEI